MVHKLETMQGKPYFSAGGKPFFWLGDTAWLLFTRLSEQDAYAYLKNRSEKGFNVIQATLVHYLSDKNGGDAVLFKQDEPEAQRYWEHCDRVIDMAAELGLYMALLPSWGSLVRDGSLNIGNVDKYGRFLADRYKDRDNVIWLLGGDIKGDGHEEYYNRLASILKSANPDRLIGYHPFGRCSSSLWFNDAPWLDFHMFQSGHRRYDQCSMGAWDDTANIMSLYGEDNWRYVQHDREAGSRPVIDGEPSYEGIPQGLHDPTQPYWTARDVRRYAYWSVLAGAAGHTYGHNAIMQFYDPAGGYKGAYGVRECWREAVDHPGAGQMRWLKQLVEKVDFTNGHAADELVVGGQREKHERVAVLAGESFLLCYSFSGKPFTLDVKQYRGMRLRLMDPATGEFSRPETIASDSFDYVPAASSSENPDVVVVIG
ncbi:MAG: DUF4038 domain-containing protein [Clostridia bacterium]|nr:DUF4038 domain-containing protein [Clostridia bacterium]